MSKQSERLSAYLQAGQDRRSPSFKNMLKHSGYADNRALIDGLRLLIRQGKIVQDVNGYWPVVTHARPYELWGYYQAGGTS